MNLPVNHLKAATLQETNYFTITAKSDSEQHYRLVTAAVL